MHFRVPVPPGAYASPGIRSILPDGGVLTTLAATPCP